MRVTRASTRARHSTDDNTDDLPPIASLLMARGQPGVNASTGLADIVHENQDRALAFANFIYTAGSSDHTGLAGETSRAIAIPNRYQDAISSPQSEQWKEAINKEIDSLKEREVYHLVPITSVTETREIIGFRFAFRVEW